MANRWDVCEWIKEQYMATGKLVTVPAIAAHFSEEASASEIAEGIEVCHEQYGKMVEGFHDR